jgi:two-component system LytT family response regulator
MRPWRVLVVDDEPPARRLLRSHLELDPALEVIGEAGGVDEAVRRIRDDAPDLVLLDIRMRDGTGFDVVDRIGPARMPLVIFVTAYDEHALAAFERLALDYLLKPVDRSRLAASLARAKHRLAADAALEMRPRLDALLAGLEQAAAPSAPAPKPEPAETRRIPVRLDEGRLLLVSPDELDWLEAEGNYVRLAKGKDRHLVRSTLAALEERLPAGFLRISRSTVVNLDRVREVQPWFHGNHVLLMHDGTRHTTSRTYKDRVRRAFGLD